MSTEAIMVTTISIQAAQLVYQMPVMVALVVLVCLLEAEEAALVEAVAGVLANKNDKKEVTQID